MRNRIWTSWRVPIGILPAVTFTGLVGASAYLFLIARSYGQYRTIAASFFGVPANKIECKNPLTARDTFLSDPERVYWGLKEQKEQYDWVRVTLRYGGCVTKFRLGKLPVNASNTANAIAKEVLAVKVSEFIREKWKVRDVLSVCCTDYEYSPDKGIACANFKVMRESTALPPYSFSVTVHVLSGIVAAASAFLRDDRQSQGINSTLRLKSCTIRS